MVIPSGERKPGRHTVAFDERKLDGLPRIQVSEYPFFFVFEQNELVQRVGFFIFPVCIIHDRDAHKAFPGDGHAVAQEGNGLTILSRIDAQKFGGPKRKIALKVGLDKYLAALIGETVFAVFTQKRDKGLGRQYLAGEDKK